MMTIQINFALDKAFPVKENTYLYFFITTINSTLVSFLGLLLLSAKCQHSCRLDLVLWFNALHFKSDSSNHVTRALCQERIYL